MPEICQGLIEVQILCVPDCLADTFALTHAVLLTGCMNVHNHRASMLAIRYSISVCQPLLSAGTKTSASLASCLSITSLKLNLDRKNMHVLVHAYLSAKQV